ncbi:MAG: Hsp20/alpha crystallin family protein [Acidimicrobiia bacterium]
MLRFDPFREFDRLVNGAFETGSTVSVPLDVVRSASAVDLYLDLPGVDPDTIELSVERNQLTLKATRRTTLAEGERFVVRERPAGDFTRTLVLSEGLDPSRISADYEHGVLRVTIPVAELAQPRRIEIGARRPVVDGRDASAEPVSVN